MHISKDLHYPIAVLAVILLIVHGSYAQLAADFSLAGDVCMGEGIGITNSSVDAVTYEWDFCLENLEESAVETELFDTNISTFSFGFEIVEDNGQWYGFATDKGSNNIVRITYGSSPHSTPSLVEDLLNPGGLLDRPESLSIIKTPSDEWHIFVAYERAADDVIRLDFGNSLANPPTPIAMNGFGFVNSTIGSVRDIEALEINGDLYVVFQVGNDVVTMKYGSSYDNVVDLMSSDFQRHTIAGLVNTVGFQVIQVEGIWYGVILNNTGEIHVITYGSDILNTPTKIETFSGFASNRSVNLFIERIGSNVYGLISNELESMGIIRFEDISSTNPPVAIDNTGLPIFKDQYLIRYQGAIYVQGLVSGDLVELEFKKNCGENTEYSQEISPTGISYSISGDHVIELSAYDASGNLDIAVNTITVLPQTAPSISLTTDFACVSATNTFTPSLTGLPSYTWDFGDGSPTSSDESPVHDYSTPGDYIIRLDINDGTCSNFTEQTITIYPDPPTPTFTSTSNECKDTQISFTNTTDESQHLGVITYEWDFNGEGISTNVNPTFSFDTPGTKQITLKSIIPGCENESSIFEIEISDGPTSAFSPSSFSICEGESISFNDQSTNNPVSWQWDFDDGFTSTTQHPDHLFTTPGNYDVALTVTDAIGCEHTLAQEVSVSSLPVVSFDFDVPCTSSEGIQFMDLSTVSGADIVSRTWYVGDMPLEEVQDQQNPLLGFGSEGTVNVRLEIQSSNGCTAAHSEDIQVLAAPQPDFMMDIGCEGEPSLFTDLSTSPGNQVTSWLWTLDGATYVTEDINHTFSGSGVFDVTLEVTSQNFCSETITKSIEVLELLTADFNVDGDCSNELIALTDQTVELQDPIVSREWFLDGSSVGNGAELILESLSENMYELSLEVTTATGCVVSSSNNIVINNAPQSIISAPKTYGVPGDAITFSNQSLGGSVYQWLFNGVPVSTNGVEETFEFQDPGTYQISLVSDNDLGCSDTTTVTVLIAIPSVDLSIGQFEIVENNGTGNIFLEIQNNSNLPIDNTEVVIELEDQFSITEQISTLIGIGESELVSLNVGVPLTSNTLSYLCASLNSQYKGFEDNSPLDNEKCLTIEPKITVEAPFPNPVTDQVRVRLIAPDAGIATITLLNSAGKIEMTTSPQTQAGLNNFFFDLKALNTGVYFIRLEIAGSTSVQRIIKH